MVDKKNKLVVFQGKEIRRSWHNDGWFYSLVDIVGVLTDGAVMEKKSRPIIPFEERLEMVRLLKPVDEVIPQETYSPLSNIKKIKPDVLIESESHKEMPANDYVKSYGGKVVINPYWKPQSSSKIKAKMEVL